MDQQQKTNDPLTHAYEQSVDLERDAWRELHSYAPGTPERIHAWKAWSEAISRTNDAWRRLNARRFSEFERAHRNADGRSHARA